MTDEIAFEMQCINLRQTTNIPGVWMGSICGRNIGTESLYDCMAYDVINILIDGGANYLIMSNT